MTNSRLPNHSDVAALSNSFRAKMESAFGFDFSDVGIRISPLPRALGVPAFTFGSNIFLAPETLALGGRASRFLMAHELAHVVQQASGRCRGRSYDDLEAEADHDAAVALSGSRVPCRRSPGIAGLWIQCWGKTESELQGEIKTLFSNLKTTSDIEKFARMAAMLENHDEVMKGLKRLNKALAMEIEDVLFERMEQGLESTKGKYYKALKRVLEKEEGKYGFNAAEGLSTPQKRVTLTGIVPMEQFNALLRLGYHWKDPGAGVGHGEYAHRLQWYIFTTSNAANGYHSLEMFKAMGSPDCLTQIKTLNVDGDKLITMWDFVLDCFTETEKNTPFSDSARAPNCLTKLISDKRNDIPVLAGYLSDRTDKRVGQIDMAMFDPALINIAKSKGINVEDQAAFQQFAAPFLRAEKFKKKFGTTPEALEKLGNIVFWPKPS